MLIVLAPIRERASVALWLPRVADGPPMLDEIEMQAIVEPRWDERGEEIVRLFHVDVLWNPAEAAHDAKDVGVDRKERLVETEQ